LHGLTAEGAAAERLAFAALPAFDTLSMDAANASFAATPCRAAWICLC